MKNIKYIILLLLIVLVAIIAFLIRKGNTKTELVYVDKVIEKEVEVEVEKEVIKYVEVDSTQTDSLKLSSDVFVNTYAYITDYKIIDNNEVLMLDIISDVVIHGDDDPQSWEYEIINKSNKTRNYLLTPDTCFTGHGGANECTPEFKSSVINMGADVPLIFTTSLNAAAKGSKSGLDFKFSIRLIRRLIFFFFSI